MSETFPKSSTVPFWSWLDDFCSWYVANKPSSDLFDNYQFIINRSGSLTFKLVWDIPKMYHLYNLEVIWIICAACILLTSLPVTYMTLKIRSKIGQGYWPSNMSEIFPTVPFWGVLTRHNVHTRSDTWTHAACYYSPWWSIAGDKKKEYHLHTIIFSTYNNRQQSNWVSLFWKFSFNSYYLSLKFFCTWYYTVQHYLHSCFISHNYFLFFLLLQK